MSRVVIGMDPHKRSATIEIMAGDEAVLGGGRYATDAAGYAAMLARVRQWPERVWAVEGCQGIGRHLASRLLADGEQVIDVPAKLSARMRVFATGQGRKTDATDAPIDASSGDQVRHRLSRAGNRQVNRALHIMAVVQLRNPTEGRAYYDRKVAAGKTPMEAMRALKRRLSDIVYRQMIADARAAATGPRGHVGAATGSSAAGFNPSTGASEKSLPGPATHDPTPAPPSRPIRSSRRPRHTQPAPARSRGQAPLA